MANIHEIIDSLNDENVAEVKGQLKEAADATHNGNKQLYARAKKAEGFDFKDGEWLKKPESKKDIKKEPKKQVQSDEPNYALDAFLEGRDVKHVDDKKLVKDEMERLNMSAGDILQMEHIKGKLQKSKDQRDAEAGMPDDTGKPSGSNKSSVDYWLNKKNKDGTYATPNELELAEKVINARMKKGESENQFSDELF